MEINVNIKCDALINAINRICDVMLTTSSETAAKEIAGDDTQNNIVHKESEIKANESKKAEAVSLPNKEPAQKITREAAREALADLAKLKGKEAAKSIIKSFDCTKFTEIPEEKYSELLEAIKGV